MATAISLDDELAARLREKASEKGVNSEELAREILRAALASPGESFDRIAAYIAQKNRELYRRLS